MIIDVFDHRSELKIIFKPSNFFSMQLLNLILHFWKGIITPCRPTNLAIQLISHYKTSVTKLLSVQSIFKIVLKLGTDYISYQSD